MGNPFAHIELSPDDVGAAKKFYKAIFDWKFSEVPGMDYTMLNVGGGPGGGLTKKQMSNQPTAWLPYVQVDSVKKSLDKVRKAGGTVMVDHTEIGEMGAIGVFMDPHGAALGVWEMKAKPAAPKKSAKKAAKPAKKAAKKGKSTSKR